MNVIVTVDSDLGWEAIPVRAIPFATGWTLPPDVLARDLAHASEMPRLHDPRSFCHTDDGEPRFMYPKEWDSVIADLASLSSELAAAGKSREEQYAIWRRESIARLPAGTFMYREEFALAFECGYGRHRWGIMDEREGDREWISHPLIPEDLRTLVMEGFERYAGGNLPADLPREPPPPHVGPAPSTPDTTGMVAWLAVVLESWDAIIAEHGPFPAARKILIWIRKNGPADVFPPEKQPPARDSAMWCDSVGNLHTLTLANLQKRLSELRTKGIIGSVPFAVGRGVGTRPPGPQVATRRS